ncbi:MAG: hypothetical protein V7646_1792 [Pseudonocardia sp.]|jgi:hypothetical protein
MILARLQRLGSESPGNQGIARAGSTVAATVAIALVVTWLLRTVGVAAWWLPPLAAVGVVRGEPSPRQPVTGDARVDDGRGDAFIVFRARWPSGELWVRRWRPGLAWAATVGVRSRPGYGWRCRRPAR